MNKLLVILSFIFILVSHKSFSQFEPNAFGIVKGKNEIVKGKMANSVYVLHTFDYNLFLNEIQDQLGDTHKVKDSVFGITYATSLIKNKKWAKNDISIYIYHAKKDYPLGEETKESKMSYNGKWVDHPKYLTSFYALDKNNEDGLLSEKAQKKFRKNIIKLVEKIIKKEEKKRKNKH